MSRRILTATFPLLFAAPLVLSSCAAFRAPPTTAYAAPPTSIGYDGEPCVDDLDGLLYATFGDQAREAVRRYMHCIIDSDTPPPVDLEMRISQQLRNNPYTAVSRERDGIIGSFFDRTAMRQMPGNTQEMAAYIRLLEDQALAARATGDVELATAAEGRAKKVESLLSVLEDVHG